MAQITFEQVTKRFGATVEAVKDLSIDILDREFLVLLGPSGCGKTTSLRLLAGLELPTAGRIRLDDLDITHLPPRDRDLAMVFQSYALYPHLSVFENIAFSLILRRTSKDEIKRRVEETAQLLGLGELLKRKPRELSGGQRQRVALGRAIIRHPKAFLMDEPLSNLDAKLRTATRAEIARLHRELAATFVYVTHDQVEAMTMATRIAVMANARLQQLGTPEEVYDRPATTFVAQFIGTPPMNILPAELSRQDGRLAACAEQIDVPLEVEDRFTGRRGIFVGVRPEHLRLTFTADPLQPTFRANVVAVEMLGHEVVVLTQVGPGTCALRGSRSLGVRPGDEIRLTCDPSQVHLFDRTSGQRLPRVGEGAAAGFSAPTLAAV